MNQNHVPQFAISPTSLSTYFLLDCERYLRWLAPAKESADQEQIPKMPFKKSPLFEALTQGGFRWEAKIVTEYLSGHIMPVNGRIPAPRETLSYAETLEALRTVQPGQWIYQATLKATDSFYHRFRLKQSQIEFRDCYPDLIYCTSSGKLRIVDAKASEHLKITHKIQTGLYAFLLQEVLKTEGIDRIVDLDKGAIWLGNQPAPSLFDMRAILPHVEHLLKKEVPRILAQELSEAPWHVNYKCEWCQWFRHCKQQALDEKNISLLPYISPDNKKFLVAEVAHSSALKDLNAALSDPDDADRQMAGSISLKAKGGQLLHQSTALLNETIVPQLSRSLALPAFEDLTVLLAVEREPSTKEVYAVSVLVSLFKNKQHLAEELELPIYKPVSFIAERPEDCPQIQQEAIAFLHTLLTRIDAFNRKREWKDQLSLQTYTFDAYEQINLTDMLLKALSSSKRREALDLLFFFRHLDNIFEDEHQDPEANLPTQLVSFPMVSVLAAMRELLALPIPLAWQLGQILPILQAQQETPSQHLYKYEDFCHYPLSNYLDSDLIHHTWNGNEKALNKLRFALHTRVRGLHSALIALRMHPAVKPVLFAYASRFLLPKTAAYQDPILSRLAFMTMNENIVNAVKTRKSRTQSERERGINQVAFRLKALGNNRFEVKTLTNLLKVNTFGNYVLWPPTEEGEKSQALYDDLGWYNRTVFKVRPDFHRSVVNITQVVTDPISGQVLEITLEILDRKEFLTGLEIPPDSEWILGPVYRNANTGKIFKALDKLQESDAGGFTALLQNASAATRDLPLPANLQAYLQADYPSWSLTTSQEQALQAVLRQSLTLVWGPPGTGKTHFIASTLAGLIQAHHAEKKPFRILVTAFTRAAMGNVMRKLALRLEELGLALPLFNVGGESPWPSITAIDKKHFYKHLKENAWVVIGATSWSFQELVTRKTTPPVDLLVIDEASQMTVPEAAQLWQVLDENSRVMVVGDHYQLPPIVEDEYPEPEGQEPLLTRSIFEAFQHSDELARDSDPQARQIVYPLLECWRMNRILNQFSAEKLYTMQLDIPQPDGSRAKIGYACASEAVAQQRMNWHPSPDVSELSRYVLDPDYPLTLCVLEGLQAQQENIAEADLVAQMSLTLRQSLTFKGQVLPSGESNDALFWSKGLFIVSPHHVQIMAIKRALAQLHEWESPPFVGTVDKMQGQEAQVVLVSYGLSDVETAIQEKDFIYDLNRLNVAITRAKSKCVVFIPRPLLEGGPAVLESETATRGLAYMQQLESWVSQGQQEMFELPGVAGEVFLSVYRR